ncbi:hypothetical protein O181_039226 [Austropuccinia psidii MF-1]|uniref:Uncharacterized protein n=1 Tax=Austropuccinia psidii MF-1 TaxID=1389203 RepID=A0A9Q3HCC4_9BASI|nr:hypothetical protein [Austropuccinia psidii MF-1]
MFLKHKNLYQNYVDEILPSVSSDTRPSVANNKIIDANAEAFNLIAGTLESTIFDDDEMMENSYLLWNKLTNHFSSSTFNNKSRIWMRFFRITYNGILQTFISEIIQCLNEVLSDKVKVETATLTFTLLTKLPKEYHKIVKRVTSNIDILGSSNSILNLLHDVSPEEEAPNLQNTSQSVALNREAFLSNTIHY